MADTLVPEDGAKPRPSATGQLPPAFHRGIVRFHDALGAAAEASPSVILYNGTERLRFKGTEAVNPLIRDGLDRLTCPSR